MSELSPSTTHCVSCGAIQQGPFCHLCGQRHPEGRLTFRGLFRELPKRLFNLDSGLLHTFVQLFRRPGGMQRDYIHGIRSPYVNPLTYFLVAATIQLLTFNLAEGSMRGQLEAQFVVSPLAESIGPRLGEQPEKEFSGLYFNLVRQGFTYQALILLALPFALALRLLTPHLKPKYNLAEITVFALYTTAHIVLLTGLTTPLAIPFGPFLQSFTSLIIYVVYTIATARGFYDSGRGRVLLPLIALMMAFTFFLVVVASLFVILLSQRIGGPVLS